MGWWEYGRNFNEKIETIGTALPFDNTFSKEALFLRGDKSDSGSTYKLKSKEVKRLRHIIASYLNN